MKAPQLEKTAEAYSSRQIVLHWMVVLFVLMQFLMSSGMSSAFHQAVEAGAWPLNGLAWMHGIGGTTILVLMVARAVLRWRHGAPAPAEIEPDWQQTAARATHYAFYVVLIAMPIFGLLAVVTLWGWVGTIHALTSWLLLALIVAHLGGALWHMVRPGSRVWQRMLRDDPPTMS